MNDLFLHDSQDTSPIVSSDRVLYTPTSFAKSARNRQISRRMDTHGIIVVERFATFHYY